MKRSFTITTEKYIIQNEPSKSELINWLESKYSPTSCCTYWYGIQKAFPQYYMSQEESPLKDWRIERDINDANTRENKHKIFDRKDIEEILSWRNDNNKYKRYLYVTLVIGTRGKEVLSKAFMCEGDKLIYSPSKQVGDRVISPEQIMDDITAGELLHMINELKTEIIDRHGNIPVNLGLYCNKCLLNSSIHTLQDMRPAYTQLITDGITDMSIKEKVIKKALIHRNNTSSEHYARHSLSAIPEEEIIQPDVIVTDKKKRVAKPVHCEKCNKTVNNMSKHRKSKAHIEKE